MQQSLIGMASHPAVSLAAKMWLMYGNRKKQYQSLNLAGLRHTVYSNFAKMLKTWSCDTLEEVQSSMIGWLSMKKRQQLYSEVFEQLLVKGACRKVFHEVWRVVVVRLSALEDSQCLGWCRATYVYSHYPSSKTFMPRFLCTKATLSALGISWLSRGLLRGTPRMSGSASYPVTSIRLKIRCSALDLWSLHLINGLHCFTGIRACQAFVLNVLFTNLELTVYLSHTQPSNISTISHLSHS